jgi:MFS superfamily sulfate permease-like transporter
MESGTGCSRSDLGSSAVAGLPGAVGSVPDGMAAAVLVGVNPIHGLYASAVGPTVGGLTAGTRLIVFGQLAGLTGTSPEGPVAIVKAVDVVVHPARIHVASLATGRSGWGVAESAPDCSEAWRWVARSARPP